MWYYKDGEIEIGPVSTDELKALTREKKINGRTLTRSAKETTWKPLAERIKKTTQAPQPKPAKPVTPAHPLEQKEEQETVSSPATPVKATVQPHNINTRQKLPFSFTGSGSEYFKIWIVNIVLSVITLGIYSAWAKVRRKQYFYGNTRVDNTSFSYLATPVTILKGRIIVFIGFVLYSLFNQFFPLAGMVLVLTMLPLLPWFIIRALAFNATNSATRNIRFTFRGTYMEAAKVYLFLPMLIPFTLGFIFPYIYYKQQEFLVDNSGYGTTGFSFLARPGDYYKIFLSLVLPFIAIIAIGVIGDYIFSVASTLLMVVFYLYAMAYVSVRSTNLLYNSSKLSHHGFDSTMVVMEYIGIVFTNTIATVLTVGLFYPFAQVRAYKYRIDNLSFLVEGNLNQFVADEKSQLSALGDEAAEFMDFDFGL